MVPTIGIMVGFYIITRMMELIGRSDRGPWTRAMAYLTIIVAVLAMLSLFGRSIVLERSIPAM